MKTSIRVFVFAAIHCAFLLSIPGFAQQTASIVGTVKDQQDAAIANATVTLISVETGVATVTKSNGLGDFEFTFVKPGSYTLKTEQPGFKTFVQSAFALPVNQRLRIDPLMQVGEASTTVSVEAAPPGVQTDSSQLGDVVDTKKIVELPLNGRFFLDLAMMTAGTVVPSTNNRTFLAVPSGIGISGINASGTREDSTNYLIDGMNLSDMVQNQITFQPNIDMVQEFRVLTNAFDAQNGRNAGIIITAVSKSGTNQVHGSAYEFLRNERFDAKNLFDPPGPIIPFNRDIYGGSLGGPIYKNKTFFFISYEGRDGHEVASLNTPVPTAAQRAAVVNPIVQNLLTLIPAANNPTGNFFVGPAPRTRLLNQGTGRVDQNFSSKDFVFGSFIINQDQRTEPTLQGNNLPGFGDFRPAKRYLISAGYTRVISPNITNELRAGVNRVHIGFEQAFLTTPSSIGITSPSDVFPQINIANATLFGGIAGFPQGRGDTTFQYNDTVSWIHGRHSVKFGAEYRRFRNNNFNSGTGGTINFASMATFLLGVPSSATETAIPANPGLRVNAFDAFVQDDIKINAKLTLNAGLRWEYNGPPSEVYNRLGVYDFATNTVVQIGTNGIDRPYNPQYTNFGPRVGFAYDPTGKGKTVLRGGIGYYFDQPVTNIVTPLGANPPFSASVNNTSNINLANPFNLPPGGSLAIAAIDPNFKSGAVMSYNFNIQHEVWGTVLQATYVGSQGRHLRIFGDLNQGINGVRPIPGWTSIAYQQSVSNSDYNGLWLAANKRLARGLTFQTSYSYSKSLDNNSVGSSNPQVQDYRNLAAEHALSDFDARQRFIFSAVYLFPFRWDTNGFTKRLAEGWSFSPIFNAQTGNPFSPIIAVTDTRGSLEAFDRPNVVPGASLSVLNPGTGEWFNTAAFTRQLTGFGNAGRNILTAPGFQDIDVALSKNTAITERVGLQFRAEAFNLLNHPNLAQPQNNLAAVTYGQITTTRTSRGDLGSSRQIQLGLKLIF
jgi:hypothetical protein